MTPADELSDLYRQLSAAQLAQRDAENEAYHARQEAKSWREIATTHARERAKLQAERLTLRGFFRAVGNSISTMLWSVQ